MSPLPAIAEIEAGAATLAQAELLHILLVALSRVSDREVVWYYHDLWSAMCFLCFSRTPSAIISLAWFGSRAYSKTYRHVGTA